MHMVVEHLHIGALRHGDGLLLAVVVGQFYLVVPDHSVGAGPRGDAGVQGVVGAVVFDDAVVGMIADDAEAVGDVLHREAANAHVTGVVDAEAGIKVIRQGQTIGIHNRRLARIGRKGDECARCTGAGDAHCLAVGTCTHISGVPGRNCGCRLLDGSPGQRFGAGVLSEPVGDT